MIETQPVAGDTAAPDAADLTPDERSRAVIALVVVLVLLVGLGVVLDRVTTQKKRLFFGPAAFAAAAFPRELRDDFQARTGPGLGTATTGQHWTEINSTWAAGNGLAGATKNDGLRRAYALAHNGQGPGSVTVTAATITKGMGLAFRCRSELNCWTLTAVPELGTWKISKIAGVNVQEMGNLGQQPVKDGTRVRVDLTAASIRFFVDDVFARQIDDPQSDYAPDAGLIVEAESGALSARFSNFSATQLNVVGPDAPVRDDFDRANAPSLGASTGGGRWQAVGGSWGIRNREAILNSAPGLRPTMATVDVGRTDGWIQVSGTTVPDGFALVFRYQDPSNYWRLVAVPGYATWNVFKVVKGSETRVDAVGLANYANPTTAAVRLKGNAMTFFVDGLQTKTLKDSALMEAHRAGIGIATPKGVGARFAGFAAGPPDLAGAPATDLNAPDPNAPGPPTGAGQ